MSDNLKEDIQEDGLPFEIHFFKYIFVVSVFIWCNALAKIIDRGNLTDFVILAWEVLLAVSGLFGALSLCLFMINVAHYIIEKK